MPLAFPGLDYFNDEFSRSRPLSEFPEVLSELQERLRGKGYTKDISELTYDYVTGRLFRRLGRDMASDPEYFWLGTIHDADVDKLDESIMSVADDMERDRRHSAANAQKSSVQTQPKAAACTTKKGNREVCARCGRTAVFRRQRRNA